MRLPPTKNLTTPAKLEVIEIVEFTPLYTLPVTDGVETEGAGKPGPGGGVAASDSQNFDSPS
jgi:hypothetical protein